MPSPDMGSVARAASPTKRARPFAAVRRVRARRAGSGQALEMGVLAAEAILASGWRWPGAAAERYERSVRAGLGVDHRLAERLQHLLAHPAGARAALRLAGASGWTRRNVARWLFEGYPRAVLATPHRWHRHLLTGPGAYR